MIKQLTIIGVGLIGGSLARAVRQAGGCQEIVGCGRDRQHLQQALDLGVIDRFETDIGKAVQGADMIVVAVPLGAMEAVFQAMSAHLESNAVITDVGSAKASVVESARRCLADHFDRFVPGHPIAGTEQSGVAASFTGLFEDRMVILTPLENTAADALERVQSLWVSSGAQLLSMTVAEHDEILAATSHLPHLLAYTLINTLAVINAAGDTDGDGTKEIFRYAAGGFRDFSRIASSDPVMWRDICLANDAAILKVLDRFSGEIESLKQAIQQRDGEQMLKVFSRAKSVRDSCVVED